jgi:hypothetical protein
MRPQVSVTIASISLALCLAPSRAPSQWPVTRLQNVQVLPEGISPEALVDTMRAFTRALGVRCSYCHVGAAGAPLSAYDFASDAKPEKATARVMLRMVTTINRDHLPGLSTRHQPPIVVACATCHRGVALPIPLPQLLLQADSRGGIDSLLSTYRSTRAQYFGSAAYDFGEVALSDVADELVARKRMPDAVRVQHLNIEMNPTSSFAHWMAAETQLAAGDSSAAVAMLRQAVALNPNSQGPRELLARLGQTP